jgi:hypothetical protein
MWNLSNTSINNLSPNISINKTSTIQIQFQIEKSLRCQKTRATDKPRKNKIPDSGKEKHLKTKNRTFENKRIQF